MTAVTSSGRDSSGVPCPIHCQAALAAASGTINGRHFTNRMNCDDHVPSPHVMLS